MLHVLSIVVLVLVGTTARPAHTYRMIYPTQYACNEADNQLQNDTIARWYEAMHKKQKVLRVQSSCQTQRVKDDRACSVDWYRRCSDALMIS